MRVDHIQEPDLERNPLTAGTHLDPDHTRLFATAQSSIARTGTSESLATVSGLRAASRWLADQPTGAGGGLSLTASARSSELQT